MPVFFQAHVFFQVQAAFRQTFAVILRPTLVVIFRPKLVRYCLSHMKAHNHFEMVLMIVWVFGMVFDMMLQGNLI